MDKGPHLYSQESELAIGFWTNFVDKVLLPVWMANRTLLPPSLRSLGLEIFDGIVTVKLLSACTLSFYAITPA